MNSCVMEIERFEKDLICQKKSSYTNFKHSF